MKLAESSALNKIPFKRINLGNALEAIKPLIESGYIGLGNLVFETEKELAEYVGARHVVLVDSCTSALFLSLRYELMQKDGLHVKLPSMTVPLALNAAFEAGCRVELDDRTDWVGHYYQVTGSNVVDSAHELRRNQFQKMKDNGAPDALKLCFSFYPTKTIGSAEGGAIATDDEDFAKWARSAATYGRNQGTGYRNSWDYDVEMIGYKRHYTNLQAAIVLEQLRRLDETNARRQAVVTAYNEAFGVNNDGDYLYRIYLNNRDQFIEAMMADGIECGVHFKPLHQMTPFKDMKVENREKIEHDYEHTVSLPLFDTMTQEEVQAVIEATKHHAKGGITS